MRRTVPDGGVGHPNKAAHHGEEEANDEPRIGKLVGERKDGLAHAVVPVVRIAQREDELGIGILDHQLAVKLAGGAIGARAVVGKKGVPVHRRLLKWFSVSVYSEQAP